MEAIDEEGEELLRIMLGVSWKHRVDWANSTLHRIWRKNTLPITPHSFYESSIVFSQLTLGTNLILPINLNLKHFFYEIVCKRLGVG